jgi:hypothetical protein
MKYIDLTEGKHTINEHYEVVENLLKDGYTYTGNRFGNPIFTHYEKRESVCIISSIVEQSGYFAI